VSFSGIKTRSQDIHGWDAALAAVASVASFFGDCYTARVMLQQWLHSLGSVALATGLLVAQLCNVICVASACAAEKTVASQPQPTQHCHQSASQPEPPPEPESHRCWNHDFTVFLAASVDDTSKLSESLHVALLPVTALSFYRPHATARVRLSALRSPPRLPQQRILRI
jgi:hypothetical protein